MLLAIESIDPATRPRQIGDFLWAAGQEPAVWSAVRVPADPNERRAPEHHPVEEIANAVEWLLRDADDVATDDLVRDLARLFGFQSTGKHVWATMVMGVTHFLERRTFTREGERLLRSR